VSTNAPVPSSTIDVTASRRWLGLFALSLPVVALSVDANGVVVLLPQIGHDLGVSAAVAGAIVTVSSVAFAAPLLLIGRIADRVGARPLLLGGVIGFAFASLMCALANTFELMLLGRALQGVASACCFTTSLAAIDALFEGPLEPIAVGIWGALGGIGGAMGPLVAAVLGDLWSWRWFFGVNLVLLGVAFVLLLVLVPPLPADRTREVPVFTLVLLMVGIAGVVGGIQHASSGGWASAGTVTPVVVGALFLLWVWRRRRPGEPLVARKVTGMPSFRLGTAEATLSNWGSGVVMVLVPIALEVVRHTSVLETGLLFLGYSIPFAIGGLLSGPLIRWRGGPWALAAGSGVMAVGIAGLAVVGVDASIGLVVAMLAVVGFGNGVVYSGATSYALVNVEPDDAGEASATLSMLRVLALALAVACSTSLAATVDDWTGSSGSGLRVVLAIAAVITAVGVPIVRRPARCATNTDAPAPRR
jgi:MYXO-CTERM domain-containing protein